MRSQDFTARREDGTLARYRAYPDLSPSLVVDCDRAYAAADALGEYNPSYRWTARVFTAIAAILLVGGFVALFWWPWWTPIVGVFLAHIVFKATKQSCADFVQEIVVGNPREKPRFVAAGIVREGASD